MQRFSSGWSSTADAGSRRTEVASLSLGDQVQAEWLPLHGITYDPKDDLMEVTLEGLDHLIAKPCEVYVQDGTMGLESVEITDAEGIKQIVKLRDELKPPPTPR